MTVINKGMVLNVQKLMDLHSVPRPRKKHKISIIVNDGEFLPVIDGDKKEVVFI